MNRRMQGMGFVVMVALVAGAALAYQVGINSQLRRNVGDPILAAFISFAIGTVLLAVLVAVRRPQMPTRVEWTAAPWWVWFGGVMGTGYVVSAAALAVRLGAAGWLATVVTGQILTSLLLDHFGWVGFAPKPMTPTRIAGAIFLVLGVALVLRR